MSISSLLDMLFGVSEDEEAEEEREDDFSDVSRKVRNDRADDEAEEDEEGEEAEDEEEDEQASFLSGITDFFKKRRGKGKKPEVYEEDEEEEPVRPNREPQRSAHHTTTRDGNVIHDSRVGGQARTEVKPRHVERILNIRRIEECGEVIEFLNNGNTVLLNLEEMRHEDCGRVVDMLSGAAYALKGRMLKIARYCYLLAPKDVDVMEVQFEYDAGNGANYYHK